MAFRVSSCSEFLHIVKLIGVAVPNAARFKPGRNRHLLANSALTWLKLLHLMRKESSRNSDEGAKRMLLKRVFLTAIFFVVGTGMAQAQGFGTLRGTVKDPTGAVVPHASVSLKAVASERTENTQTDTNGAFTIWEIPFGEYKLEVQSPGFAVLSQPIQIIIGSAPNVDLTLSLTSTISSVDVTATTSPLEATAPSAASPPVLVSSNDIMQALPGADRMSSLQFITETTPGAFVLHDHLHVRGGHQINWLINGVPVPNTNMSSNVGRALDPKDIEEVEINRGGYGAQSGDRTFAQVNVITRSGFEFNKEADSSVSYGSDNQTNDQVSFGGHSEKFAFYTSLIGNRTDLGLEPPVAQITHDMGSGEGIFTTMSYKLASGDQLDWTATVRNDRYQIPTDSSDLNPTDTNYAYLHDIDQEWDSFITLSWTHAISSDTLLTVSPFFHYNNAQYIPGATDPFKASSLNTSNYLGAQAEYKYVHGPNNLVAGLYGFYEHNNLLFGLAEGSNSSQVSAVPVGGVGAAYLNDQYKPWKWLTFNAGIRLTHFSGETDENAANPRVGASIQLPKLNWVLRSFYGTYYQPPPLYTVGGGVFGFELANEGVSGYGFEPLKGERDIQREFGLTIPLRAWVFDFDHFDTTARNFLDHDLLGNSNILLPLTTPYARINGTEATVRTPEIANRLSLHLAFSNMMAQYKGAPDGGLIEPVPSWCLQSWCYLDHDQRNTLSTGFDLHLPRRFWFSNNVVYGSGVLKANGPEHLPQHTTADAAFGKSLGERMSLTLTALNVSNSRYPFSVNNSFAGTHFNNPREIIGSVRYRFQRAEK
jgi:hypothetical protein